MEELTLLTELSLLTELTGAVDRVDAVDGALLSSNARSSQVEAK